MNQAMTPIHVTRVTTNSDGFGLTEKGETAYISPSLVRDYSITAGQVRKVRLLPNSQDHIDRGVPWRAHFVEPLPSNLPQQMTLPFEPEAPVESQPEPLPEEPAPPVEPSTALEKTILDTLARDRVASTAELASALDTPSPKLRHTLDRMHARGDIIRADVWKTKGQGKAGKALWARSLDDLLKGKA